MTRSLAFAISLTTLVVALTHPAHAAESTGHLKTGAQAGDRTAAPAAVSSTEPQDTHVPVSATTAGPRTDQPKPTAKSVESLIVTADGAGKVLLLGCSGMNEVDHTLPIRCEVITADLPGTVAASAASPSPETRAR